VSFGLVCPRGRRTASAAPVRVAKIQGLVRIAEQRRGARLDSAGFGRRRCRACRCRPCCRAYEGENYCAHTSLSRSSATAVWIPAAIGSVKFPFRTPEWVVTRAEVLKVSKRQSRPDFALRLFNLKTPAELIQLCRLNAIDFVVVGPDAPPVTLPKRRNVHCHDCLQPELHPSADAALFERVRGGSERCRPECREWLRPVRTAYLQVRRVEEPRVVRGTSTRGEAGDTRRPEAAFWRATPARSDWSRAGLPPPQLCHVKGSSDFSLLAILSKLTYN
jgi:hypothetical protein